MNNDPASGALYREAIKEGACDPAIVHVRHDLGCFTALQFAEVGQELHVIGHVLGDDRNTGLSPFGHGDDAIVAISLLLRIAGQLVGGTASLTAEGRHYAGAALIRQLVEVEYLAWAFEVKDAEAGRWLRSTSAERRNFFTPAKLRAAAQGRFRGADYGYHCELGGHPVPGSWRLLNDDGTLSQLMLSDCLGHAGRIWDHTLDWSRDQDIGGVITRRADEMARRFAHWKAVDTLTRLPPPPETLTV